MGCTVGRPLGGLTAGRGRGVLGLGGLRACEGVWESVLPWLIRPKILYFENILSHLKSGLSAETGFDFTNSNKFVKLFKAVPYLKLKIKNDGHAIVKHTLQVPDETLQLIYDLLANVQALLTARIEQNEIQYCYVLEKIPQKYK